MRIVLSIHHKLDPNAGAPGVVLRLSDEYRQLGHEVRVLSYNDMPGNLRERARHVAFPWFFCAGLLRQAWQFDVLDASSGDAWAYAAATSRRRGPLLVTHSHGLEHTAHLRRLAEARSGALTLSWKYPLYHGGFRLWEVAQSFRAAELALFLNRHDLEYAVEELGVRRERARVVRNGIPEAFIGLPFKESPESSGGPFKVAQVGSYIPRKGTQYGAPALNRVLSQYSQVKISFLGTGCSSERVYADFEPSLRERIEVIPAFEQAELPNLLLGYHVKLFPTLSEGFPLALLEGMACGLAAVTTATPGPLEFVKPEVEGLVVPPRDPVTIEVALRRLIEDRALLNRLRRNAYETAQAYGWSTIAATRLALYEEFLARKRDCRRRGG